MLKTFLLALFCAGCVFTAIPQDHPSTQTDRDSDSDEIYAAVVNWRTTHPGEGAESKRLVFLDTTIQYSCFTEKPGECPANVRENLTRVFAKDLDPAVLSDYLASNRDVGPLSKSIPTSLPQSWLSSAEWDALFKSKKRDGWKSFYAQFPGAGGFMKFSRVGFNEKRDRALLYSTISCGWLCGTGYYHLLKRESGQWVLFKNYMAWIS
jgi:hypothetical protein